MRGYAYCIMHAPGERGGFEVEDQANIPCLPTSGYSPKQAEKWENASFLRRNSRVAGVAPGLRGRERRWVRPRRLSHSLPAQPGVEVPNIRVGRTGRFLVVNERCRLVGIPAEAHEYRPSGESHTEWTMGGN